MGCANCKVDAETILLADLKDSSNYPLKQMKLLFILAPSIAKFYYKKYS